MNKQGERLVISGARITILLVSGIILYFLLLQPDALSHIQKLPVPLLLIIGFFSGLIWMYRKLDNQLLTSKRNKSDVLTYITNNTKVKGGKIAILKRFLYFLATGVLASLLGPKGFLMLFNTIIFVLIPELIGMFSAIPLWERRRHLRVYSKKLGLKQWETYFIHKISNRDFNYYKRLF